MNPAAIPRRGRARHARLRGFWWASFSAIGAGALALLVILAAQAAAGTNAGVHHYNKPVCGRQWVAIDTGHGDYANVYNTPVTYSCVKAEQHHDTWMLSSMGPVMPGHMWQMPVISWGTDWGKYTCYDGPSGTSPGTRCMQFPVQAYRDGSPVTSVTWWHPAPRGNVAYDIWFDRKYVPPQDQRQADGAEIMIWLAHPGICLCNYSIRWHVTIQGRRYAVFGWRAFGANGVTWLYTAYVAVHPVNSLPPTWLNMFFRDAEKHHRLSSRWWLSSVNFGSEINCQCAGLLVSRISLSGIPDTPEVIPVRGR